MAFVLLGFFSAGFVLLLYGRATGGSAASLAGFTLLFGPLGLAIVHARLRAKRDPAFAREVAETQARMAPRNAARLQFALAHLGGLLIALAVLVTMRGLGLAFPASLSGAALFLIPYALGTGLIVVLQAIYRRAKSAG
ncbi:MAG TPA: hypothetical protein VN932_03105 [Rhizomicrobium sp.]|nr:hypothetical protein [Rhizomicrobium sp.]